MWTAINVIACSMIAVAVLVAVKTWVNDKSSLDTDICKLICSMARDIQGIYRTLEVVDPYEYEKYKHTLLPTTLKSMVDDAIKLRLDQEVWKVVDKEAIQKLIEKTIEETINSFSEGAYNKMYYGILFHSTKQEVLKVWDEGKTKLGDFDVMY